MEAILPFKIKNEQKFFESALKVGFDEMEIYKYIYVLQLSDLDIFPKMHDERINILIYGWEICEDYKKNLNASEWELPEELETILKFLVPWSMDIWFSKEWDKCKYLLKSALIHCLNRGRDLLMRMPDMMQINWDFLMLYNLKPWNVAYLKNLTVTKEKTLENGAQSIETEELPATDEDIAYVKLEQLPIIVLRLVKFFDQSSIDMVKTLCMRVIAAWNKIHQTELETSGSRRPYIPPEDKKCLMLICHIYLMAVYESDDVKGYIIDNMINNIRFYYQGFQNSTPVHAMNELEYTPARYIALTNIHLRVQKRDFFDFFIWNKYDTSLVNLFGVVSQAYKSYLLGNLLMELNNMNEDDFTSNIPLYKRLMNSYVNEREKSEIFLINELNKIEAQRYAHNIILTVKNISDFKSKICKGNRMSNIGNYENSDDTAAVLEEPPKTENNNSENQVSEIKTDVVGDDIEDELERVRIKESELRLDPIFQNLPHNESILYYVYDVLAKKDYKGWHFAKVVLLMKIIALEQNMIETWRYHPGLTTDFMLNLEVQLSQHYVDLAKIFKDHPFLEQEFWLTAFYLNPTSEIYETIKRLGMRNNRKRTDDVMSIDNIDAKYGLLSSTIDVKELASMSNTDDPTTDYDPLFSALHSLRVPDSLVKDMLTAIFLPRNRSFAWSVDWVILRHRCKMILTSSKEKKRFVDLNMAEANDRLKYLIIDYEKYKNRPQLDYGTIEEGYENLMAGGDFDKESEEEEEEEEEEDFEDDEDVYESKKRIRGDSAAAARKKEAEEKAEEDNSQEDDPYLMGKRRTRARTAATLASFLFLQTLPRSSKRKKNPKDDETKGDEEKISADNDDKSSDSKSPIRQLESQVPSILPDSSGLKNSQTAPVPCKNLKERLQERPAFLNTTHGFQNLIDIWNVDKSELQTIDENCVSLMESSTALQIAVKLKLLNKEINPMCCDENEYIDDSEMIIHNTEFVNAKQSEFNIESVAKKSREFEKPTLAMELDNNKEIGENNNFGNINMEANVDKTEALDIEVPEGSQIEMVMKCEIEENEIMREFPPAEENSCETTNSDMSTAAHRDSREVSESNTEINSKRNSINFDLETDIKTVQNNDSVEEIVEETQRAGTSEKEKETIKYQQTREMNQELENEQNESVEEVKLNKNSTSDNADTIPEESRDLNNENREDDIVNQQVNSVNPHIENHLNIEEPANDGEKNAICESEMSASNTEDCKGNHSDATQSVLINESENRKISEEFPIQRSSPEPEKASSYDLNELVLESLEKFENQTEGNQLNEVECTEISNLADKANEKTSPKTIKESTEVEADYTVPVNSIETNSTDIKVIMQEPIQKDISKPETINEDTLEASINSTDQFSILKKSIANDSIATNNSESINTINDTIENTSSSPQTMSQIFQTPHLKESDTESHHDIDFKECILPMLSSDNDVNQIESLRPDETQSCKVILKTIDSKATLTEQNKLETLKRDIEKDSHSFLTCSDNEGDELEDISDSETQNLKKLCLTRDVQISLYKLSPADLKDLRQPKVKLRRISYEKYTMEYKAKRRCFGQRVYLDLDDSSNSLNSFGTNTSSSEAYRPKAKVKRKIPIRRQAAPCPARTSDSEEDVSNNSDDCKLSTIVANARKRRLSTPSTSQSSTSQHITGPKSARKSGPKSARRKTGPKSSKHNLIVTPRSASGLKLRISNAEQNYQEAITASERPQLPIVYDEIIQLSSSSDDEQYVLNDITTIDEELIEMEDHPLFEEEIII